MNNLYELQTQLEELCTYAQFNSILSVEHS